MKTYGLKKEEETKMIHSHSLISHACMFISIHRPAVLLDFMLHLSSLPFFHFLVALYCSSFSLFFLLFVKCECYLASSSTSCQQAGILSPYTSIYLPFWYTIFLRFFRLAASILYQTPCMSERDGCLSSIRLPIKCHHHGNCIIIALGC